MDIALVRTANGQYDIALDGADLATDDGLATAVAISLLTDARADADDELPGGSDDPRGFWGDSVSGIEGDNTGSKLWLLARAKTRDDVLARARSAVLDGLAWLIDDGIAPEIQCEPVRNGSVLEVPVRIPRPAGGTPFEARYQYVWEAY